MLKPLKYVKMSHRKLKIIVDFFSSLFWQCQLWLGSRFIFVIFDLKPPSSIAMIGITILATNNKHTNKQTNKQTYKQTNIQTNKQTNKHTNKQTHKHTNKHTNKQTS
jgi:hypothetical protein